MTTQNVNNSTKIKSTNCWVLKAQSLLEKANGDKKQMEKAFTYIRDMLASSSLGKDFGETMQDYYDRTPFKKEFKEWSQQVWISKDYKLVKY